MDANPILPLSVPHREAVIEHFLSLPKEDLRLRFGHALSIPAIVAYVDDIDFAGDGVFGVLDSDLRLIGLSHLALLSRAAEFGVSVLPAHRNRGVGSALFDRAIGYARNRSVRRLFVHCRPENRPMMRIIRNAGMRIAYREGEIDAWLALAPADPASFAQACLANQWALWDFGLKSQCFAARTVAGALAEASSRFIRVCA